jgi:hypothetical protein
MNISTHLRGDCSAIKNGPPVTRAKFTLVRFTPVGSNFKCTGEKRCSFAHLMPKANRNIICLSLSLSHRHIHTHKLINRIVRAGVPLHSRSLTGFSSRIPGNDPDVFHIRWVVDDIGRGRVLSECYGFPCWVKFHRYSVLIFFLVFSYQKYKCVKLKNLHSIQCSFIYQETQNR